MAVVHVSTWPEFKTAIAVTGDIVIVDNDLDANGDPLTSAITIRAAEVDGQDHAIYNISSTGSHNDFYAGAAAVSIHNLNFYNYACYTSSTSYGIFYGYSTTQTFTVQNCKFQGISFKPIAYTYGGTFKYCSFSFTRLDHIGAGSGNSFTACWFDIGSITWNTSSMLMSGTTSATDCYFKGSITSTLAADSAINLFGYYMTRCVFNFYLDGDHSEGAIWRIAYSTTNCIYNSDRIHGVTSNTNYTGNALTDSQMKDATAVAATGFPIVT